MNVLEKVTGLRVRMAQEGARKYFAGLLRVVDNTVQIHADFAPHVRSPFPRVKCLFRFPKNRKTDWNV